MKSYKISALRRRIVAKLPTIALVIWMIDAILILMIVHNVTVKHTSAAPKPRPQHIVRAVVVEKVSFRPQTEEGYALTLPYGDLVWKTFGHESSYGKNDSCRKIGMYNGFGYAEPHCYASFKEVADKVSAWFAYQLQTKTVKEALCYYNMGEKMQDCEYAEYTLAL